LPDLSGRTFVSASEAWQSHWLHEIVSAAFGSLATTI